MTITELGAIGELVGGVAVVASLIFVGFQIRANTKTLSADATTRAQMEWAHSNQTLSQHPDRETLVRFLDPGESFSNFTPSELNAIVFFMRSVAQQWQAQFFQHRANLLQREMWEAHLQGFASLLQVPAVQEWWQSEKTVPIYTESFLNVISKATGPAISPRILTGGREASDPFSPDSSPETKR